MKVEYKKVGPMDCNCVIAICPETKESVIVDPGGDEEEILEMIERHRAQVKFILITHAHFDHVHAARRIRDETGAPILMHQKDKWLFRLMPLQFSACRLKGSMPRPDTWLAGGETLKIGEFDLDVLHTPGHSPGSCCFHLAKPRLLFSGDTLFRESSGNWEFPGGDLEALYDSITKKLMVLPDETRVIPGHNDETTIGHEREHNQFLKAERFAALRRENKPFRTKSKFTAFLLLGAAIGFFKR